MYHHGLAEPSEPHSSNPSEERWVRQEQEYDATLLPASAHHPHDESTPCGGLSQTSEDELKESWV